MPLSALLFFQTGTYTVSRPGSGVYTDGVWVPAASSTFPIDASIQPAKGKDLQFLPEGFTIDGTKKLYTETMLQVGDSDSQSDTVAIGSETWRVVTVEHFEGWDSNGHYKAMIAKTDEL